MEAIVMMMPSTAATIPNPGIASAVLVSTATGMWSSSVAFPSSASRRDFSWSGLIFPSMIGLRPLQRNSTAWWFFRNDGYLLKMLLPSGFSTCSSSAIIPFLRPSMNSSYRSFRRSSYAALL